MADLDPIPVEDLEALRDTLALVARVDLEAVEIVDFALLGAEEKNAVIAAANAAFGLLDLLAAREASISSLTSRIAEGRRQPRVQQQANGDQLWGER